MKEHSIIERLTELKARQGKQMAWEARVRGRLKVLELREQRCIDGVKRALGNEDLKTYLHYSRKWFKAEIRLRNMQAEMDDSFAESERIEVELGRLAVIICGGGS